jgi:apolipoprotein N-acyltransferase
MVAGAVLPLAFAPFDYTLIAVLSPAVLFYAWSDADRRQAVGYGLAYGIGMFGTGASWVHVSINEFGHTNLFVSVPLTALFVLALAALPAVTGYLLARWFPARKMLELLLVMPALWVLQEWVRGWYFTGFPWLYLGYTQVDSSVITLAPITGIYGVSTYVALLAALLAGAVRFAGMQRVLCVSVMVLLYVVIQALPAVEWTQPAGRTLQVSLVQGNISQHDKWKKEFRQPTLELYRNLSKRHWHSDVIVWPETAVPALLHDVKKGYISKLAQEARQHGSVIIAGIPIRDEATRRYYNSVIAFGSLSGSSTRELAYYHKSHLVPFGEYMPFTELLRGLVAFFNLPMSNFSAGEPRQAPFDTAAGKISASVCYEIAFAGEMIRRTPAADLLVNVSNDAWFGKSVAPNQHLQIARVRAVETGRPILRATNTGITAIIDHLGRLTAMSPPFRLDVLEGRVQPRTGMTPYARTGNSPVLLFLAGLLVLLRLTRAKNRQ